MYKMSNTVVPPGKKQLVGHSGNIYSDTDDSDDELNEKPFKYVKPKPNVKPNTSVIHPEINSPKPSGGKRKTRRPRRFRRQTKRRRQIKKK
jgi:hypothetical protein